MVLSSPTAVAASEVVLEVDTPLEYGPHSLTLSEGIDDDGGFILIIRHKHLSSLRTIDVRPSDGNLFSVSENDVFLTTAFKEVGGIKIDLSFLAS